MKSNSWPFKLPAGYKTWEEHWNATQEKALFTTQPRTPESTAGEGVLAQITKENHIFKPTTEEMLTALHFYTKEDSK